VFVVLDAAFRNYAMSNIAHHFVIKLSFWRPSAIKKCECVVCIQTKYV